MNTHASVSVNIHVVNLKLHDGPYQLIGRPSRLGNPLRRKKHETIQELLVRYRRFLWEEIKRRTLIYEELLRLLTLARVGELNLGCWCHPGPCHGDIIKAALIWLDEQFPAAEKVDNCN